VNREIVINAIKRKKQGIFPSHIEYTPEMGKKIAEHLGVDVGELPDILNQYIRVGFANDTVIEDHKNGIRYDNFGIGWDLVITEGFFIRHYPLENIENYKNYQFPNPNEPKLAEDVIQTVKKYKDKYFVIIDHSFTLWERAYCLRGFENFLIDMIKNTKFAEELLDRITEYQVELAKRFVAEGVDGGLTGGDWGQQSGLIFSPDLWRKLIKPRIARIWKVYKDADPIQPQAMPIKELSKKYAKDLSFWGGLSLQRTLPFGTREDVTKEVEKTVRILGAEGGYIISPAHELTSDVPIENFNAMMEAIRKFQT